MPASSAAVVVAMSSRSSWRGVPTTKEIAESEAQPLRTAPQSIDTRSPSSMTWSVGMPCTTASLTLAQITPGNGVGAQSGW